jgi:hypothetical protein
MHKKLKETVRKICHLIKSSAAANKLAIGEAVLRSYMMDVLESRSDANEKTIIFAEALAKMRMAKRGRKNNRG